MTDDAWKQCTRDEVRRCGREKHLNKHIIRLDVVTVVFLGGCVGTGLRYASSSIADVGGFHVGTFAANMVACFVYAALSAWLGSSSLLTQTRGCPLQTVYIIPTIFTITLRH